MFTYPFNFARSETLLEDAKYAVLGIPYDASESYSGGSRYAPNEIRESSMEIEDYDMEEEFDLLNVDICDCGNIDISFGCFEETSRRIRESVKEIISKGVIPIGIGGEHTISYSILEAYEKKPFFLVFDAHLDFRDDYIGNRFSHACVTRRISEIVGCDNVLAVGVRSASREELDDAGELGLRYIKFKDIENIKDLSKMIDEMTNGRDVYLSIDMDAFDPKEASGVCNPVPPGFLYEDFVKLDFFKNINLVGFDITEVTPVYDSYTPILAAMVIYKIIIKNEKKYTPKSTHHKFK